MPSIKVVGKFFGKGKTTAANPTSVASEPQSTSSAASVVPDSVTKSNSSLNQPQMSLKKKQPFSTKPNSDGRLDFHEKAIRGDDQTLERMLNQTGANVDVCDAEKETALHWAARLGHEKAVAALLNKGASIDKTDNQGRTPLQWAVIQGKIGVVRLLVKRGADVAETDDKLERSAVHWAAIRGYDEILKELLDDKNSSNGGNVDLDDLYERTPLIWAAMEGQHEVVKTLLNNGASSIARDNLYWRTALHWAAYNGHQEVVRTYISTFKADALRFTKDKDDRTPLHLAAERGHADVLAQLLELDSANIMDTDGYQRTPLHYAAENGHKAAVRMLLEAAPKGEDWNKKDMYSRTPLWRASWKGHENVVVLLLNDYKADTTIADINGRTPLSAGAGGGHVLAVEALLNCYKTNKAADAAGDHVSTVKTPLQNCDINEADRSGRTALSWAATGQTDKENEKSIVQMLLEKDKAAGAVPDNQKRVPLHWAAFEGNTFGLQELLDYDKDAVANESKTDTGGLHWASVGYEKAVKDGALMTSLLSDQALPQTTPTWPSDDKYQKAVRLLLERGCYKDKNKALLQLLREVASTEVNDVLAQTALRFAVEKPDIELVKVVLDKKTDVNMQDRKTGQTALHLAAAASPPPSAVANQARPDDQTDATRSAEQGGSALPPAERQQIVERLVQHGSCRVDIKDETGQTALHVAAGAGNSGIVTLLLLTGKAKADARDKKGQTPLHLAARQDGQEYHSIAKQLCTPSDESRGLLELQDEDGNKAEDLAKGKMKDRLQQLRMGKDKGKEPPTSAAGHS